MLQITGNKIQANHTCLFIYNNKILLVLIICYKLVHVIELICNLNKKQVIAVEVKFNINILKIKIQ